MTIIERPLAGHVQIERLDQVTREHINLSTNPSFEGTLPSLPGIYATVTASNEWAASGEQSLKVDPAVPSRRGVTSLGHPGASIDLPAGWNVTQRMAFQVPAPTARFRIGVGNWDFLHDQFGSGTVSIHSTWIGEAELDATGQPTGAFDGAPTQIAADTVYSVDGAPAHTDWITTAGLQLRPGVTYLLSVGINLWTACRVGIGTMGWIGGNILGAGEPGGEALTYSWGLFDWWIDWEGYAPGPVVATFGHSLNGAGNVNPLAHPWAGEYQAWHNQVAAALGGISLNYAVGGSWLYHFAPTSPKWEVWDALAIEPDIVAIYASSSDLAGGRHHQEVLLDMLSIVNAAAEKWPGWARRIMAGDPSARVLVFTEPGRMALDNNPRTRAQLDAYNELVRHMLGGNPVYSIVEAADALTDPYRPYRLRRAIDADGEHYTIAGHTIVRDLVLPLIERPVAYDPVSMPGMILTDALGTVLEPGKTYTVLISCQYAGAPAPGYVTPRLVLTTTTDGTTFTTTESNPADSEGLIRFTFTTPPTMIPLGYSVVATAAQPGMIYYDDLTVIEGRYEGAPFTGITPGDDLNAYSFTGAAHASPSKRVESVPVTVADATAISIRRGGKRTALGIRTDVGLTTITFKDAHDPMRDGTLEPGQRVRVKAEGLPIFTGKIGDVRTAYIVNKSTRESIAQTVVTIADAVKDHGRTTRHGVQIAEGFEMFEQRIARLAVTATTPIEAPPIGAPREVYAL